MNSMATDNNEVFGTLLRTSSPFCVIIETTSSTIVLAAICRSFLVLMLMLNLLNASVSVEAGSSVAYKRVL